MENIELILENVWPNEKDNNNNLYKKIYNEFVEEGKPFFINNSICKEFIEKSESNDYQNSNELTKILIKDIGLTTNILKLINSAYFSLPNEIKDIKAAIDLLGPKRITNFVIKEKFDKFRNYLSQKIKSKKNDDNRIDRFNNITQYSQLLFYLSGTVYQILNNIENRKNIDNNIMTLSQFSNFPSLLLLSSDSINICDLEKIKLEKVCYILLVKWHFPDYFLICTGSDFKLAKSGILSSQFDGLIFVRAQKYLCIIEMTKHLLTLIFKENKYIQEKYNFLNFFEYNIKSEIFENINISDDKYKKIQKSILDDITNNDYMNLD